MIRRYAPLIITGTAATIYIGSRIALNTARHHWADLAVDLLGLVVWWLVLIALDRMVWR